MGHGFSRKSDSPHQPDAGGKENASSSKSSSKAKRQLEPAPATTTMACSGADESAIAQVNEESENYGIIKSLSERAREILRKTWCNDFDILYELGTDIYCEIFRLDPSVKKLFKALDGYDLEKDPAALRQCAAFSKQALRFVQTISMTVQNCAHLNTIEGYLKDIGRRHVQYKQAGFEPGHWRIFETAITNVTISKAAANKQLDEEERQILADSYRQLSRHIVAVMTAGFRGAE